MLAHGFTIEMLDALVRDGQSAIVFRSCVTPRRAIENLDFASATTAKPVQRRPAPGAAAELP
jgi:hypothetical protein